MPDGVSIIFLWYLYDFGDNSGFILGPLGTILGARGMILEPWAPFSTMCRQSVDFIGFAGEKPTPQRVPEIDKIMQIVV